MSLKIALVNRYYDPFRQNEHPPNDIHRWKAVDLSFLDVRAKIDFFQPSDRQNFANALGQNCIHDLRLHLMMIIMIMMILMIMTILMILTIMIIMTIMMIMML